LVAALSPTEVIGQADSISKEDYEKDVQEFTDEFYSEEHINEYCRALDVLRELALDSIYEGSLRSREGRLPSVDTSNKIHMVYTVISYNGAYSHYFSVSRPPYLATVFAKFLVVIACERFNLQYPTEIERSQNIVYHCEWALTSQEHKELIEAGTTQWPESMYLFATKAIKRTKSIEINNVEIDIEQ
jgi:hypothetical protein